MKFILASGNAHKAEEFAGLFDPEVLVIDAAPDKIEVDEDADTFTGNALKKAKAYFDKYQTPVMSDDSGLVVEAMPTELGIHTARFGGDGLSSADRYNLLLERMKGLPKDERRAHFVCVLCFYISDDEVFFFEGQVHGHIGDEARGEDGFGYDPVFIPENSEMDGATLAMLPEWKSKFSHRSVAVQRALEFFKSRK